MLILTIYIRASCSLRSSGCGRGEGSVDRVVILFAKCIIIVKIVRPYPSVIMAGFPATLQFFRFGDVLFTEKQPRVITTDGKIQPVVITYYHSDFFFFFFYVAPILSIAVTR